MIPRYTRPEMGALWGEDAKYARWLRVELAVCEAWARRGIVPADALDRIRRNARVDALIGDATLDEALGVIHQVLEAAVVEGGCREAHLAVSSGMT